MSNNYNIDSLPNVTVFMKQKGNYKLITLLRELNKKNILIKIFDDDNEVLFKESFENDDYVKRLVSELAIVKASALNEYKGIDINKLKDLLLNDLPELSMYADKLLEVIDINDDIQIEGYKLNYTGLNYSQFDITSNVLKPYENKLISRLNQLLHDSFGDKHE